jgi:hypothetical protein
MKRTRTVKLNPWEPNRYIWRVAVEWPDDEYSGGSSEFKYFPTEAKAKAYKAAQLKRGAGSASILREIDNGQPPEPCGGRKPAEQVTDRALRYRANSEDCKPKGPQRCMWCGAYRRPGAKNGQWVEVGHIDGDETNTTPENLAWTCRPCNQRVASNMKKAGVGRRTNQYNPKRKRRGISDYREFQQALAITRGDEIGYVQAAVEKIRATPMSRRSEFQKDIWAIRKERYGPSGRKDGGALPF